MQPVRVVEQHKTVIEIQGEQGKAPLETLLSMPTIIVGDWLLLDKAGEFVRALERKSCFRRKAAGHTVTEQLIAANVDTAFIVCSLNEDFNLNRIERYLCLANEAQVEPVVVLSKKDICPDYQQKQAEVQAIDPSLQTLAVNGLDDHSVQDLQHWCSSGQTIVLLGSSGSGKSTLTNALLGQAIQATSAIRQNDAKGRHTTTRRTLLPIPNGAMILDTPGMRELQLTQCEAGVAATFSDVEALAQNCKFSDCQHASEPGCAVTSAIETGHLDERRLTNYLKLMREQAMNSASLAKRRAGDKNLGRYYKKVQKQATDFKRG